MRKLSTVDDLEAIVGARSRLGSMKSTSSLDDGCREVLASAPVAGLGFRDTSGAATTTVVGGAAGFTEVHSPTRIRFELPADQGHPTPGGGAGLIYLLRGIGETLRVNGVVAGRSGSGVTIDVHEAFVHCGMCIHRSGLWRERPEGEPGGSSSPPPGVGNGAGHGIGEFGNRVSSGPLADGDVARFLASTPFVLVSSWDADGSGDTSPRGDERGFVRVLDGSNLAIPDRKGNRRTDTFHNLLSCDQLSLAAVVPGRDDVLHLTGTGHVTDDADLLATMTTSGSGRPPKAALVVRVHRATVEPNDALRVSQLWSPSSRVDASTTPDLMALAAQHSARALDKGATAPVARVVNRGLSGALGRLLRRAVDRGYRTGLADEGYGAPPGRGER